MKAVAVGAHLTREEIEPLALAVPMGELFLSAVEVADDQPLGDRDLLLRVASVRGRLLEVATFVAIRYGFSLSGSAEAEAKCGLHLVRWKQLLTEHRQHVEITLKVAASGAQPRPDRHAFTSGADYLRALHQVTQGAEVDGAFRGHAERLILPCTVKHRWTIRDERSVELAALVERSRFDEVRAAGEALRHAAPDIPFLLSGPWPLEVFADDDRQ